ncbi:hypothetical protein [Streptomyces hokutonensis]|uniref:hypothetical protein n=1 Tax=Streptomyces hokutonensis TaxID=1306990 RepID=UPI0036B82153
MADGAAISSLISGIGGALIGGLAGVYGPGRIDKRRRRHESEMERIRRFHEDERRRGEIAAENLKTHAEASQRVQDWYRLVAWTIQDLEAGRAVDVTAYDEKAEPALQAVVKAVSLVNFDPRLGSMLDAPLANSAPHTGGNRQSVTVMMNELTRELRACVLASDINFDSAGLSGSARAIRDSLVEFLSNERQIFIGRGTQMNFAPIRFAPSRHQG